MTTIETALRETEESPKTANEHFGFALPPDVRPQTQAVENPKPKEKPKPKKKVVRSLKHYDAQVLKFLRENSHEEYKLREIADVVGYEITGVSRSSFVRRIELMVADGKIARNKVGSTVYYSHGEQRSAKEQLDPVPDPVPAPAPANTDVEKPMFTFAYYPDHVRISYADALKITQELAGL